MEKKLEKEFSFYLNNQAELVEKYAGKFIVIKDEKVIGTFDDEMDAVSQISQNHELGTFLVQFCAPGSDSHTQVFHSRVIFA